MEGVGGFEGNAQTFRVLTRLEAKHRDYEGLDLCRATLLGVIKDPYRASAGTGKYLYDEDADTFEDWLFEGSDRSLVREPDYAGDPPRIVCQLMDWADDVAYAVHDLEDGIAYGFLSPRDWTEDFFIDGVRDLLLRVVVVGGDQEVELLAVDLAWKHRRRKGRVERLDDRSALRDELGDPPRRRSSPAVWPACPTCRCRRGS